ncbi:glycoside hydrolase family 5 [Fusarium albosuccineum]|uniref:Glycoside hydrolase family 5 n=1 Tax=Fusarium albosuccineum TaxID=1237068 RepID=A0A8H4LD02_9HYPO|nr:glycoside hydrolase family 5 [Fusarium albosuccineum]
MVELHAAADLSEAALGGPIRIQGSRFVDNYGRTLSLRGLNVSGASKLPTKPNGLSHLTEGFYEHRTVTFVGRPFPLEEAPLHFRRLQEWGCPLVRLLVTWESIGHSGPDPETDLDLEYIAYLRQLIELMPQYGIKCFVCAHQDVWSRFSGGSGAPGWTFEVVGLDVEAFTDTGAAYVHSQDEKKRASEPPNPKEPGGPFLWPSGYQKLAASTMATLFWAGDALAPNLKCRRTLAGGDNEANQVPVQSFLQDAFIEAFGRLADEVGDLEACLGFEPMNEPHRGLINLHHFHFWNYDTDLHIGHCPSLAQCLALGSGYAQEVNYYVKSWPWPTRVSHKSMIDPKGRSAWLSLDDGEPIGHGRGLGKCVWHAHGVWEWDDKKQVAQVFNDDYFEVDHRPGRQGKPIEWYRDCYAPFLEKFSRRMSRKHSRQFSFVEPIPNEFMPPWPTQNVDDKKWRKQKYAEDTVITTPRPDNFVYAPHFYDLNVLFNKYHSWMSVNVQGLSRGMFVLKAMYFGSRGLRKNYKKQIGNVVKYGRESLGEVPTVIGEIGISYDINGGQAFRTGCYDKQRDLMAGLISAMEDNGVGYTLWNYNPHNRVEYGDGWNKEDFSVINSDEIVENGPVRSDYRNYRHENDELYKGGRVLDVIIRPYAVKTAGIPLHSDWDSRSLLYEHQWKSTGDEKQSPGEKSCLTEIFIPRYHYATHELRVQVHNGEWTLDRERQTLYVRHKSHSGSTPQIHKVVVEIENPLEHRLGRIQRRREVYPPKFPLSLVPPIVEAWSEDFDWGQFMSIFLAVVAVVVALLAMYIQSRAEVRVPKDGVSISLEED